VEKNKQTNNDKNRTPATAAGVGKMPCKSLIIIIMMNIIIIIIIIITI